MEFVEYSSTGTFATNEFTSPTAKSETYSRMHATSTIEDGKEDAIELELTSATRKYEFRATITATNETLYLECDTAKPGDSKLSPSEGEFTYLYAPSRELRGVSIP